MHWNYIHKEPQAEPFGPMTKPIECQAPIVSGGMEQVELKGKQAIWSQINAAETKQDFYARAKANAPFEYANNYGRLREYADAHYKEPIELYKPLYTEFPGITEAMRRWIEDEMPKKDRPKTLVLMGPTRLGKTMWARSLGEFPIISRNHLC